MLNSPAYASFTHNAARIAIGITFWSHGAQKLFGWFGRDGNTVELFSLMGLAGTLEFFGGMAIILGLFMRPVAFVLSGEMAFAYFLGHVARNESLWWWANRGELPVVYCFIFLFLSALGAGTLSVDAWLKRRKAAEAAPAPPA